MSPASYAPAARSDTLSPAQARRIALVAQGFSAQRAPRGAVGAAHLRRVIATVGIVQIDSVNVVARSHYLPFYSRVGPYDPALLDALRDGADGPPGSPRRPGGSTGQATASRSVGQRGLVEYWAHEASLIAPQTWPLLGFRMRRAEEESWGWMKKVAAERPGLVEAVYGEVAARGPMTHREVEAALRHDEPARAGQWGWNWSAVKAALEHLFWAGRLTSAGRSSQFERRYAVPGAVLPPEVIDKGPHGPAPVAAEEAVAALIELAARAHGVGSEACLRDYARLSVAQARPAIERLVADGMLRPVAVQGWRPRAYLHRDARIPARLAARALLSPFDSLVWSRARVRALFGFDYRLEFYTPAPKRVYGYYVMPFLLGDRLVGRVDCKADRAAGVLRVRAVHWEECARRRRPDAPQQLAAELQMLAAFLRLDGVVGYAGVGRGRFTAP